MLVIRLKHCPNLEYYTAQRNIKFNYWIKFTAKKSKFLLAALDIKLKFARSFSL